jgi:hypothetical protein
METRAKSIGKGGVLKYACPANCGDEEIINASFAGNPALGERIYVDIHDGAKGSLAAAQKHVANFKKAGSKARVVVWETNTARHDFSRVIDEGSDLNDLQRGGSSDDARVDSRVQSFCMEKSAHDPGLDTQHHFLGDQGAVFFTANQTWGQPPFYVHQMILDTPGQDLVLDVHVDVGKAAAVWTQTQLKEGNGTLVMTKEHHQDGGGAPPKNTLNVLAAKSHAGDSVVLRVVNNGLTTVNITVDFTGTGGDSVKVPSRYTLSTLASPDGDQLIDNPISDPTRHSPVVSPSVPFDPKKQIAIPAVSFQILVFAM